MFELCVGWVECILFLFFGILWFKVKVDIGVCIFVFYVVRMWIVGMVLGLYWCLIFELMILYGVVGGKCLVVVCVVICEYV